ncbi:MAG: hypothetical protein LQ346_007897 [Caloplaca aetnensis]|nr:MAG: hypothetical protein LQ346_007897 [Caloplaca aetnensis]
MLSLVTTLVIFSFTFSSIFAQSLVQESAPPSTELSSNLDQFAPVFGGLALNNTSTRPQCFANQPGYPRFQPVYRPDCFILIYSILLRPSAATPFRYDATRAERPRVYEYKTCVFSIYAAGPTSKEVFTELAIVRVAALVIDACATPARGFLGGTHFIGASNGFQVALDGHFPAGGIRDKES